MKDEIRLVCMGKSTPASRLVSMGVAHIDKLRQVGDYAAQQVNVTDSEWFHVRISGGHATLTIYDEDESDNVACLPYQSGMTQFGIGADFRISSAESETRFWSFQPSVPYAKRRSLPLEWQKSEYGLVPYTAISTYPTLFPPGLGASLPDNASGRYWAQSALLKPSLYSGKMRHVVQILLGSNVAVPYDFRFSRTHGVFVGTKGGKPNDWLVEISASKGILAIEMPACTKTVPKENTLGYVPNGDPFPEGEALNNAIKAGKVRVLMAPSGLADVYKKSPFSGVFGWAFNYTGAEASCVVSDTSGQYLTTFLYTVHISQSLDGGPGSATLSIDETGQVIGEGYKGSDSYGKCMFKVPLTVGGASFPVWLGPLYGTYAPGNCKAPLHVWYEQSGRRRVVWYENSALNSSRPPDEYPLPPECATYDGWVSSGIGIGGTKFIDYPPGSSGSAWHQKNQIVYVDGYEPPSEQFSPVRTVRHALASSSYVEDLYGQPVYPWHTMAASALKLVRFYREDQSGYYRYVNSSVVVPAFEREAVLFHNSSTERTSSTTSSYLTFVVKGATAAYEITLPAGPEADWQWTSDHLLIGVELKDVAGSTSSEDWEIILDLWSDIYTDYGSWTYGDFGGFSSSLGSSNVDPYLVTPSKYSKPPDRKNLVASHPLVSYETTDRTMYNRSSLKCMVGNFGIIRLDNSYPFDSFYSETSGPTDPAWFSFVEVYYPLIQSWDAALRYSPPQLNSNGFEKSNFGTYKTPFSGHYYSINFVGDA